MKEEDLDWFIYHLILDGPPLDQAGLAARAGCSDKELAASLIRLESSFLIVPEDRGFRARSIQEFMLASQSRYDPSLPFVIEGGIIRKREGPD